MSHINVAISTTKYTIATDINLNLREMNIPVCVADIGIDMFNFGSDVEREEHNLSKTCQDMAKLVHIDSTKRYVFIGENIDDTDTALVEYTDDVCKPHTAEFFKRWDETHILLFEFIIFGHGQVRFGLKGLWNKTKWHSLEITTDQSIVTIPSK